MLHFTTTAIWTSEFSQCVTQNTNAISSIKEPLLLIFSSLIMLSIRRSVYAHLCQLSRERKELLHKKITPDFLVDTVSISGGHICVPKLYIRMASTYLESDFKICNTEDDGCTVETCLENYIKLLCLCRVFMWLSILLLLSRPTCKVLMMREMFLQISQKLWAT